MLILYRGFAPTNTYTWSPFVTKLEARLRFDSIKYKCLEGSTREGPRGKVPYVDFGGMGKTGGEQASERDETGGKDLLGDSNVIVKEMVRREIVRDLNEDLRSEQALLDLSVRGLLEEKLYFFG